MSDLTTVVGMASKMAQPLGSVASNNVVKNLNVDRYRDGSLTAEKTDPTRTGLPKQPDTDHQLVPNSNPAVQQHIKQLQQHVTATTSVLNVLNNAMTSGDKDEIQLAVNKADRVRASMPPVENGDIPLFNNIAVPGNLAANNRMVNTRSVDNVSSPLISLLSRAASPDSGNAVSENKPDKSTLRPDSELWALATNRIHTINNSYLDAYVHATDVYSRFFNQYNTDVAGTLNGLMASDNGGGDKNENHINFRSPATIQYLVPEMRAEWTDTSITTYGTHETEGKLTGADIPAKTVWPSFKMPVKKEDIVITYNSNGDADFKAAYPGSYDYLPTYAGAKHWAKEFGLPESCVRHLKIQLVNEGEDYNDNPYESYDYFVVTVDITPIDDIARTWANNSHYPGSGSNHLYESATKIWYTPTEYQDIRTITTASETRMKSTIESIGTRYSNANNTYNNLVKILSSTIQTTSESAKDFLRI